MATWVNDWWLLLRVVAVFNLIAWIVSAVLLRRRRASLVPDFRERRWSLWLSAGYVLGCAFRSFLPRIDLERICLMQTWLSRMTVGRSVATVAELCFMAQCALLLYHLGRATQQPTQRRFALQVSYWLMPLIVLAECASWYAVLSTNYFGHFVENSLWTLCAGLLLASLVMLWSAADSMQRQFLAVMMLFAGGYIMFMLQVDLPMYWHRGIRQLAAGVDYLPLAQGWLEASRACVVSFEWQTWREEIPWMTLYFTIAVWISIWLPHVPAWRNGAATSTSQ